MASNKKVWFSKRSSAKALLCSGRYDNEAGYSRRLLDLVGYIAKKDASA